MSTTTLKRALPDCKQSAVPDKKRAKLDSPDFEGMTRSVIDAFKCAVCYESTAFLCKGHSLCQKCFDTIQNTSNPQHPVLRGPLGMLTKSYAAAEALETLKKPFKTIFLQSMEDDGMRTLIEKKLPGLTLTGIARLADLVAKRQDQFEWFANQIRWLQAHNLVSNDDQAVAIMEAVDNTNADTILGGPLVERLVAKKCLTSENVVDFMAVGGKLCDTGITCLKRCMAKNFLSSENLINIVRAFVDGSKLDITTADICKTADYLIQATKHREQSIELMREFGEALRRLATGKQPTAMRMLRNDRIRNLFSCYDNLDDAARLLQKACEPLDTILEMKGRLEQRIEIIDKHQNVLATPLADQCIDILNSAQGLLRDYHLTQGEHFTITNALVDVAEMDCLLDRRVVHVVATLALCVREQLQKFEAVCRLTIFKLLASRSEFNVSLTEDQVHAMEREEEISYQLSVISGIFEKTCERTVISSIDIESPSIV